MFVLNYLLDKNKYFGDINIKINIKLFFFLETRKSTFSSKCLSTNSIILLKTNEIVSQEKKAQQNYKQLFHKHYHLSETETH